MHSKMLGSDKVKISSDTTALLSLTSFAWKTKMAMGIRAHLLVILTPFRSRVSATLSVFAPTFVLLLLAGCATVPKKI